MTSRMQNPAAANGRVCEGASLAGDTSQLTIADDSSQYRLISRVRKNKREELRIAIREFTHFRGIDIRVFQLNAKGEFVETPRAVVVRFPVLPEIIEALQLAAKAEGPR
jgi:hypothetical protein